MKNGVALVDETGKALEEIVQQVGDIDKNVIAIVVASKEQSLGLKEINQAVNAMDHATQKNAAMVEENTAASHKLTHETEELRALLAQFGVAGDRPSRTAAASPRSRPRHRRLANR